MHERMNNGNDRKSCPTKRTIYGGPFVPLQNVIKNNTKSLICFNEDKKNVLVVFKIINECTSHPFLSDSLKISYELPRGYIPVFGPWYGRRRK